MTEFFNTPPQPDYWERTAQFMEGRDELARREVMAHVAELQEPVRHLTAELRNQGVPTDVSSELGNGWLISQTSVRSGKDNPKSITLLEDGRLIIGGPVTGEGSARRVEAYRDPSPGFVNVPGKTMLGRNKTILGAKKTKWVEAPRGALNPVIDLTSFPVHPVFTTEKGYTDTTLAIPELVSRRGSPVTRNSREGYVAANIERLEHDLRASGRRLLGYDRS